MGLVPKVGVPRPRKVTMTDKEILDKLELHIYDPRTLGLDMNPNNQQYINQITTGRLFHAIASKGRALTFREFLIELINKYEEGL